MPSSAPDSAAGWYGKLPALGDFASRRLDAEFIHEWDDWLSQGLAHLKALDPQGWLKEYLDSPSWRFLLMPGLIPKRGISRAWAGVLMPSVDQVGRYFPFTIVQALPGLPTGLHEMRALAGWLEKVDDIAADALHDDWLVDRLEEELGRALMPVFAPVSGDRDSIDGLPSEVSVELEMEMTPSQDLADLLVGRAIARFASQAPALALWHAAPDTERNRGFACWGLPTVQVFEALLGKPR